MMEIIQVQKSTYICVALVDKFNLLEAGVAN